MRRRRNRLDDEVVVQLGLGPRERVLAHGADPQARPVVATDGALILQRRPPRFSRLPWDRIDRATFTDGVLTVVTAADDTGPGVRLRIPLADPGQLPEVVRERVTSAVVLDRHVPLRGRRGVHVVARRPPLGDSLTWTFVPDDGLVLTAAEEAAAVAAVAAVRAEYG